MSTTIPVTGPPPYDVVVGHDVLASVPAALAGTQRVAVIFAPPLAALAERVAALLTAAGSEPTPVPVPDAESGKNAEVLARCWDALGAAGFTRSDAVVGVGGGAVTDLAGFVAATWLRGVRWAAVPTSLLGMVDAAVGGKTGINTAAGKNLVGAFHPPAVVAADLDVLRTLPPADLAAGLAEVVKCGFIADPTILKLIEADPAAAQQLDGEILPELVERAIRVKAKVVSTDLHEAGLREVLNYGHTLGHAVEQIEGYQRRHGEAVAIGLVYAAALARHAGRLDDATVERHRTVLQQLRLPTTYRADAWPQLRAAMNIDKKTRGATLRFVILDGLARPATLEGPSEELLAQAYSEVAV
ncbi:3-dehydroquinate synthase [Natronosporangium hydrolyticum]|uniref:3-dehydroquinate synthase n=1 Tax=Natronosporangium hydrolyticum TaxID=2811111 RepID=A0A895YH82_9ACTN|nr:3-dehydroquinate synthase [Natronosporangium hydrolyticum]QSB17274.1 3-dehydroquinate synthase [Natronosporangium hydrolyticum]